MKRRLEDDSVLVVVDGEAQDWSVYYEAYTKHVKYPLVLHSAIVPDERDRRILVEMDLRICSLAFPMPRFIKSGPLLVLESYVVHYSWPDTTIFKISTRLLVEKIFNTMPAVTDVKSGRDGIDVHVQLAAVGDRVDKERSHQHASMATNYTLLASTVTSNVDTHEDRPAKRPRLITDPNDYAVADVDSDIDLG